MRSREVLEFILYERDRSDHRQHPSAAVSLQKDARSVRTVRKRGSEISRQKSLLLSHQAPQRNVDRSQQGHRS